MGGIPNGVGQDGQPSLQGVLCDTGDQVVRIFENGPLVQHRQIDGNGSGAWFGRQTLFDDMGVRNVTIFETEEGLPDHWSSILTIG